GPRRGWPPDIPLQKNLHSLRRGSYQLPVKNPPPVEYLKLNTAHKGWPPDIPLQKNLHSLRRGSYQLPAKNIRQLNI
ncbi:MAG: hypothetical protein II977_06540, partial [Oscillospiraceae bacterium]|nr:hypothetical protein [Oscillospiraceae bacterium]